jgi:hypothetical protein
MVIVEVGLKYRGVPLIPAAPAAPVGPPGHVEAVVDQTEKAGGVAFHRVFHLRVFGAKGTVIVNDVFPQPGILHDGRVGAGSELVPGLT